MTFTVGDTLTCLLDLEIPVQFIQGNCEVAVLTEATDAEPPDWYPVRGRNA